MKKNTNNQNTGFSVRYTFSNKEGAKIAKKKLDLGDDMIYSDVGQGMFIVYYNEKVTSPFNDFIYDICEEMYYKNIDCSFDVTLDKNYHFNSIVDFYRECLLYILQELKEVYRSNPDNVIDAFADFISNHAYDSEDHILEILCNSDITDQYVFFKKQRIIDAFNKIAPKSACGDPLYEAYEIFKELYRGVCITSVIENPQRLGDEPHSIPWYHSEVRTNIKPSDIVAALDVIIKNYKTTNKL